MLLSNQRHSWSNCGFFWCCRARDKKKNIATEKAQAQRRLLRATNRHGVEKSEHQRQKEMLERRKEELVCATIQLFVIIIILMIIIIIIPGQYLWCGHHDSESLREFTRFT